MDLDLADDPVTDAITSFSGEFSFLSNMHPTDGIVYVSVTYPTVEHAYVAAKTTDPELRRQVLEIANPRMAKKFGRTFDLRPGWEEMKLSLMNDFVRQKFNSSLKHKLLSTNSRWLIEGNWWGDRFWGVCKGVGLNHLGHILMTVREELR
ncbi:swarming motility YbiA-like protein [Rhizobium phage RHph_I1_18]|nr:swarming motility YbiA-like protein [Rhizobium phage RHph_I1_18]